MLHLKRFSSGAAGSPGFGFSGGLRTKIAAGVTFPTEALDMRAFLSPASPELAAGGAAEYDLVGVVNHMGSLNGGHYVADARNRDSGQWNNFNDSHVRSTSSRALSPTAA
jgi:ubiquitin C-terminal hydrolase